MKRIALFLALLFYVIALKAQQDSLTCKPIRDTTFNQEYYLYADSMPEYPGGQNEMLNYIASNFKYPEEIDVYGKVIVEFIIDQDGKMVNLKIKKGLQEDFDNEFLRVMKTMPDWKPGKCKGKSVNVKIFVPMNFKLN